MIPTRVAFEKLQRSGAHRIRSRGPRLVLVRVRGGVAVVCSGNIGTTRCCRPAKVVVAGCVKAGVLAGGVCVDLWETIGGVVVGVCGVGIAGISALRTLLQTNVARHISHEVADTTKEPAILGRRRAFLQSDVACHVSDEVANTAKKSTVVTTLGRRRAFFQSDVACHIPYEVANVTEKATTVASVLRRRRALLQPKTRQETTTAVTTTISAG